jgi:hypothetical protein
MTNLPPFGAPLPSGSLSTAFAALEAPLFVSTLVAVLVCAVVICVGVYRARRPARNMPVAPRIVARRAVEIEPSQPMPRVAAGGHS